MSASSRRTKREVARGLRRALGASRLLPMLLLFGCSWFTDFKEEPKIDPWETASDTVPFRGNPQYSVPVNGSFAPGFEYARLPMPQTIATMAGIKNPTPPDSASVNRGRVQFQINCAPCHGPLGMGNGPATRYGMAGIAIGAGSNAANNLTDGYIFGMIRNGRGLMPTYNRIEEMDRWDIINYLRSIQGKLAIRPDTSHCLPGETGACVPASSQMGPTRPSPYYPGAMAAAAGETSAGAAAALTAPPDTTRTPAAADTTKKKSPTDSTKKPELEP